MWALRLSFVLVASALVSLGLSASSGAHATGNRCPMSHVHYVSYPGVEQGLANVPWISSAPDATFKAHLFFSGGVPWSKQHLLGARIFTTRKPRNINPKVLWITRSRSPPRTDGCVAVPSLEEVSDTGRGSSAQSTSAGNGRSPCRCSQSCKSKASARGETSSGATPIRSSTSEVSQ
jgi:hypothetical protein